MLPLEIKDDILLIRNPAAGPQIVVLDVLEQPVFYINHYLKVAGHRGDRELYNLTHHHFYWQAMAVDCYATVRRRPDCARILIKLQKNAEQLQLFPSIFLPESASNEIIGELIRTEK